MPLHNVRFGLIDSYKDLGLILSSRDISAPQVKDNYVDIEGGDGSIDLTEVFGDVFYENRDISLTFISLTERKYFWDVFSKCQNLLHGRRFNIVFDDDSDWYYVGRVSIDKWKTDKVIGSMTFDITADPYKYFKDETLIKKDVTESVTLRLINNRKPVNPIIKTTSVMNLLFNDKTIISPQEQEFTSPDIRLVEGENILKVTGTGTITIRYRMGSL